MSITPCWNANILTWESDPFAVCEGTVWWSPPRGGLGFPVYFDTAPRGFHCGLRLEFRDEAARRRFHHELLKDIFKLFPGARVPGGR